MTSIKKKTDATRAGDSSGDEVVLEVRDLRVIFHTDDGDVPAVRGNSFTLRRGQTLALVGESGSGKSVTSYAILRLIQDPGRITAGQILFHPRTGPSLDLAALRPRDPRLFGVRGGQIAMIFQEPMTALSPVHTIGNQVTEAVRIHQSVTKREAWRMGVAMLGRVGIPNPEARMKQYPFEFSGGMRQRVVIAMALVCRPEVLIADEPTTALDVTIQAQILELINELRREMGTSVIFITHDLGVVAQVADRVVVMNQGLVVESAPVLDLFDRPYHPYTRKLLSAMPRLDAGLGGAEAENHELPAGLVPDGYTLEPPGGDYHTDAQPVAHPLEPGGRNLLLWPAVEVTV